MLAICNFFADKTGDVFNYAITKDATEKAADPEEDKALLGHLSMLLDIKLTEDRRHLLTCDRDEKIRVSSYPNCYNIAGYCLGHSEFVTSLALVPGSNHKVLSSSGDGTVKVSSSTHVTFCF